MEPDDLLCSRNARPEKALVGRAQWKINQPPSLKRERASLEGPSLFARCGLAGAYRIFQRRDPYEPSFSATC
jgi:hypothetical protein